ncbi:hypothetical protein LAZ67_X003654 [Cordylochernes scorpioides]|uniref:RNase H type-1 domain-containing protein n=1 Tax=Cordylochernes scorpioides TaxID=51811 RepID=A0ABY6LUA5_9ARAC|nr:hypothetical protein LAZ67_X003654 [Cordylochernes scorpioides]
MDSFHHKPTKSTIAAFIDLSQAFDSQEANSSVTVQWLPAHVGIPGNELADSLAKAVALGLPEARESTTQLNERDLLHTIKTQCLQEWHSNAAHDWYRAGGTSTGSVLPKEQQSLISRLKSGHLRTRTFQNCCKVSHYVLSAILNLQPQNTLLTVLTHPLMSSTLPRQTPSKVSSFTSLIP